MLIKSEFPILEYDDNPKAIIMPDIEGDFVLPEKAVFAFLSHEVKDYAQEHGCKEIGVYNSLTKRFPIFETIHQGERVCFCQAPVGAPAATQILDHLIFHGVKEIVAIGCCGVLTDIEENYFLVPTEALRDEGTSYHYLPPSRTIQLQEGPVEAIKRSLEKTGIAYSTCKTWTTDGFFRETKDMVRYRKEEGCTAVDMECSALAACAQLRRVTFGQILFTADTLADLENYDLRGVGKATFSIALEIGLDAVCEL